MTPSIEVARKIAKAFDVSLDFLFTPSLEPKFLEDKELIARFTALDEISAKDKEHLMYIFDAFIRDCKARQAYRLANG